MLTRSAWCKTARTVRSPQRRSYDHRLRLAIAETGNPHLFVNLDIPPSTRRSWSSRPVPNVVALHPEDRELVELQVAVAKLEAANAKLRAVLRLLVALVAVLGGRLGDRRVESADDKTRLLRAVDRTEFVLGRTKALRVLGLTPERTREWKRRALECRLEDAPSCPKFKPQQLTLAERRTIRRYVGDLALRHLSIASLALLAARRGDATVSAPTWYREIRRQGLRRPRKRVHPRRPKVGVRASAPNEIWHIDASRVRLLDGAVAWIHGVVDNFSRRVLAWTIAPSCEAAATEEILRAAVSCLPDRREPVVVVTDDGSENLAVEHQDFGEVLRRVRAQVDVTFSNSMVENLWHQAKHRLLYMHELRDVATLRRMFGKYVDEHNSLIPRVALGGRTPDEVFFGREVDLPERLAAARTRARAQRVEVNRALTYCGGCDGPAPATPREEVVDCR